MIDRLNIFVDSKTKESLGLEVLREKNGHIFEGRLYSKISEYPIIRGIPRFVDRSLYEKINQKEKGGERQTIQSFGIKWRSKRSKKLGYFRQDVKFLEKLFITTLGCETFFQLKETFKGAKRSLNAGCGVAWSEFLFNFDSSIERHAIDISLSVEVAYNNTNKFDNVIVSQASIFELPYQDETFDIIYSIGVIHHTHNPKKALKILAKKLIPNGLLGIYVYSKKPFLRELADQEIRKITTKMTYDECLNFSRKMSRLGKALSKIQQPLEIKDDIKLIGLKKGKYSVHQFIYDYLLKCWYNAKQNLEYADLVNLDWYHPYYASHHTKDEIVGWFKDAGIRRVKVIQPKGWEHSGYFVSGRKN
jgi:SAM-dependent methyltransferase/uncharacterized protein YbaR (Trm112 family)